MKALASDIPAVVQLAAFRVGLRQRLAEKYGAPPSAFQIAQDPVGFLKDRLGCQPYAKQIEMAEAVRDNRRVATLGANGTGKDFCAARLVLWWMTAFSPAKCIIVAPTFRQVASIVWKETHEAYMLANPPLGGMMHPTPRWDLADNRFALGFSTESPMGLQGFHSAHLLVIVSEAHAMAQADIDALKRLNPERMLLTGNPLAMTGEFYEAFHGSEMYHTINISAFDTPNVKEGRLIIPGMVTAEDVEERKREWGEDSPLYKAAVLGQFPDSLEDTLIPRAWIDRAIEAQFAASNDDPLILACDVARYGNDKSVLVRRNGPNASVVWRGQGNNTMEVTGQIKAYLDDHPEMGGRVVVDDTGVGGGVTDRLREMGYTVVAFIAGAKARDPKRWVNAQAEAWGLMAQAFRDGHIHIPKDPALVAELASRRYQIQSDRTIKLESKDDLRAKGGKSPDHADALAMTYFPGAGAGALQVWV